MVFSSMLFVGVFLPLALLVYYVFLKSIKARNYFLFAISIFFYATGEPRIVFLMMFSILYNYFFALAVEKKKSKAVLAVAVAFNLIYIFIFKYYNFFSTNISSLFHLDPKLLSIALPIGISFYTFQSLSYVIDVYRGDVKAQHNIIYLGLYISFFPQLIAGPIVRYTTVNEQIQGRITTANDMESGVERFIIGLIKKIIIANNVAFVADMVFEMSNMTTAFAWIGAISYTIQIYFDFSGYSDMAIGLGRMFGFHFNENFNYPYIASSITDFWRRWHISLSTWFRDYVYIPLGGSRTRSVSRHIFNLFMVWLLTGLWHGANWTFIAWGLYFFVILIIEKYTKFYKFLGKFSHVYSLIIVMISWVMFRSKTLTDAALYIKTMFSFDFASFSDKNFLWYLSNYGILILISAIASTPILKSLKLERLTRYKYYKTAVLFILFLVSLSFMLKSTYNPFIYFNF